jgi:hypothetical protein
MLTDTQKAQMRLYLGYPDHFRYKHTRLESVLDNLSPEAETQVASALASIATVETAILESVGTAGVKRVDEIWFENGWVRASQVRKTGRMYVARLSIISGVPIYSDVFGTAGYLGDSFSGGGGGQGYGRGGFYGLG